MRTTTPASLVAVRPSWIPGAAGPVLIATDAGGPSCEALCAAGRMAATAFDSRVEVVGVCEPMPGVAAGAEVFPVAAGLDESRRAKLLDDLRRSTSMAVQGDPSWPVTVLMGSPAWTLAHEATRRNACLLIMGIGRHNPLDRLFGTETTLATLRESRVPVLAVGPDFPVRLTRVVVAVDFSTASIEAAHMALRLLAHGGQMTLVHVRPHFEHPTADWQAWDSDYSRTLPPLFEQLQGQLDRPDGVTVDHVVVRGDPAPAFLAYAQKVQAELIAMGTQRHSVVERLMVGSVATRILRTARCSVLAVPGRPAEVSGDQSS